MHAGKNVGHPKYAGHGNKRQNSTHQQKQTRLQLAGVLKAIVSMRLIPCADGHGRVPAVEVMIATPFIRDCIINKDKTKLIHEAIAAGVTDYIVKPFKPEPFVKKVEQLLKGS